jgi:hypothetical protein
VYIAIKKKKQYRVSGVSGVSVSGFHFRGSQFRGFSFGVSGFRFRGFGFGVSVSGILVSGFRFRGLIFGVLVSGYQFRGFGFRNSVSGGFGFRVSVSGISTSRGGSRAALPRRFDIGDEGVGEEIWGVSIAIKKQTERKKRFTGAP